jgi:3-oxoacyl-[acyl-carrier protein] reductase
MSKRFEGKVVVITGAGSGMGRAGALAFAEEGASVVVADIVEEAAQATAQLIGSQGGKATALTVDVTNLADVRRMIEAAVAAYGAVDILWNNAGVLQSPPQVKIEDLAEADWDRVLSINLKGVFLGCKCVVPQMRKQGKGVIINTGSLAGIRGQAVGMAAYTASKGGVVNLTRQLATELGPDNIRVNAIAPGMVNTPLIAAMRDSHYDDDRTDATRSTEPEEIARTVLHLAADDVGPITGAIISIDGGRAAG